MTDGDIGSAELARRMGDVLRQFENLVKQVEDRYVRKDVIDLYQQSINLNIQQMQKQLDSKANKSDLPDLTKYVDLATFNALLQDVKELKDNSTWLWRTVVAFIVIGVLGSVIAFGGAK